MQQIVKGSNTILYPQNGGGYLTQSYPTQYREFWPSKTLTPQDSIENYREATAEEKQQWDAAHPNGFADVELPSDELVKMWKALCRIPSNGSVGDFNERTAYFELNGLRDITTAQARIIVADAMRRELNNSASVCNGAMLLGRTNLPGDIWYNATVTQSVLYAASNMEVFILQPLPGSTSGRNVGLGSNSITECAKLHTVGHRVYPASSGVKLFKNCPKLENVDFGMSHDTRRFSFSIADCPLLSYATVESMCRYGDSESKAITITLHPVVYNKLLGNPVKKMIPANETGTYESFTQAQWNQYGATGHLERFNLVQNYDEFSVGDIAYVEGHIDGDKNKPVYIVGIVSAVNDNGRNSVSMKSIFGVVDGEYAGITQEEQAQWSALLTQAAERNITFATSGS